MHAQLNERVKKVLEEHKVSKFLHVQMLLKLSGIQMTSRRALRQVKSVRIVKKTLSVVSEPLWQLNEIPEEIQRIFDAVGLDLQQYLRNLLLPLPP
jgi:hypothetical protein